MSTENFSKTQIVHLWLISVSEAQRLPFNKFLAILDNKERIRCNLFTFEDDKWRFALGRAGLRIAYSKLTGLSTTIIIDYGLYDKPYIKSDISFNISHSGDYVVVVISKDTVGVDIEQIRYLENLNNLSKYSMSSQDFLKFQEAGFKLIDFYKNWTIKEAIVKGMGIGFNNNQNKKLSVGFESTGKIDIEDKKRLTDNWFWTILKLPNQYAGAIATRGSKPFIQVHSQQILFEYLIK